MNIWTKILKVKIASKLKLSDIKNQVVCYWELEQ